PVREIEIEQRRRVVDAPAAEHHQQYRDHVDPVRDAHDQRVDLDYLRRHVVLPPLSSSTIPFSSSALRMSSAALKSLRWRAASRAAMLSAIHASPVPPWR